MQRVRLRDVASVAHVSVSTASAALAGRPGVSAETRAAVIAAARRLGYRPHSAGRQLRVAQNPVILILVDPLLREGANVASMSFAGRLLTRLSEAAVERQATAVIIGVGFKPPPADAAIIIETGSHIEAPPNLGFGVPVVYTGVPWAGWETASITLTYDFDQVAATVLSGLRNRGCSAIQVCRPVANATWLHRLSQGCEHHLPAAAFHDYDALSAEDAERCGFDAARAGDAVFLISNRRQGEVVAGVRRADQSSGRTTPLVVFGEGVTEAAYVPPVGVLSLAPEQGAEQLVDTALWALGNPGGTRHARLEFRFVEVPRSP